MGKPMLWPADRIQTNENNRLVSDNQITSWNNKLENINVTDWNNAITSGFYSGVAGASNAPDSAISLSGYVITSGNLVIQQLYPEDTSTEELIYYIRKGFKNSDNITWSKWFITNLYMEEIEELTYTLKGYDKSIYKSLFNELIPSTATSIIFTDIKMPSDATLIDVDEDGDGGVVAWLDTNDNTKMYVSTQHSGIKVEGNSDSDSMFYGKSALTSIDLSNFDTSNVTDMSSMFGGLLKGCDNLTSLDVSKWNTSKVTSMYEIFKGCRKITTINGLEKWNTGNVTDMGGMFYNCRSLTTLDVSNFDTSKVTNMSSMFSTCEKLTTLDVSNFDTSKVTNMNSMFYDCEKLTTLDVSNFDTSKVTNMKWMFNGCKSLTSLDVSNFNTSNVTSIDAMFYNCRSLTTLDVSNFDTSKVTNMSSMFSTCEKLTTLDVSNFDTSKVTNMNSMFAECSGLTSLDVSNFDTSNVTDMYCMFSTCSSLTTLDLSNFDTSNVTTMSNMFIGCSGLKTIKTGANFKWACNLYTLGIINIAWQDETGKQYWSSGNNPKFPDGAHTFTRI